MYLCELEGVLHVLWPYPVAMICHPQGTETIRVFCHSTISELGRVFTAVCRQCVVVYDNGDTIWTCETLFDEDFARLMVKIRAKYPLVDAPYWEVSG